MTDDLYQELILDHCKWPRNFGAIEQAHRSAEGYNPLCGDRVTVHVRTEGGRIQEVRFEGSGCAISTASASMMTESVQGKTLEEAEGLFKRVHKLMTEGNGPAEGDVQCDLGSLEAFAGVRKFPIRVKCATLAWHTLRAALAADSKTVSTE